MSNKNAWISGAGPTHATGLPALICLPYAGGGASIYRQWAAGLKGRADVVALQPPGREERLMEPPLCCWREMIAQMVAAVEPIARHGSVALFGYSMGGMLAYELVRALRRRGIAVAHLFVAAAPAPHLPPLREYLHLLSDARLADRLRVMGGTPTAVLNHPEMMRLILPTLRADFAVLERYHHEQETLLDCPITVFGGAEDPEAPSSSLSAWGELTEAETQVQVLPAGHFFLQRYEADVIGRVAMALEGSSVRSWCSEPKGRTFPSEINSLNPNRNRLGSSNSFVCDGDLDADF